MLKIKERDEKIFNILFRLKAMTAKQICKYIEFEYTGFIKRSKELINCGYMECSWMDNLNKNIYSNGIMVRKNQERLNYKKKVKINNIVLEHNLFINDVYIHLVKELGIDEEDITTERETFWKKTGILDKRKKIKVPDLIVKKGDRLVAIEIEKTLKNKKLIFDVLKSYDFYTSFYCVRYICLKPKIKDYIIRIAEERNIKFVKAYMLDECYGGTDIFGF